MSLSQTGLLDYSWISILIVLAVFPPATETVGALGLTAQASWDQTGFRFPLMINLDWTDLHLHHRWRSLQVVFSQQQWNNTKSVSRLILNRRSTFSYK